MFRTFTPPGMAALKAQEGDAGHKQQVWSLLRSASPRPSLPTHTSAAAPNFGHRNGAPAAWQVRFRLGFPGLQPAQRSADATTPACPHAPTSGPTSRNQHALWDKCLCKGQDPGSQKRQEAPNVVGKPVGPTQNSGTDVSLEAWRSRKH
jgi:hypothetical protein